MSTAAAVSKIGPLNAIIFVRRNASVFIPLTILGLTVLLSVFAHWLPLADPNNSVLADSLLPPGQPNHILGTDSLGRDIMSRLVFSIQTTTVIAFIATVLAFAFGVLLGILAGFWKQFDLVVSRVIEVQMAFPSLILAIAIVAALGGSNEFNMVLVLAITGWVEYARVSRGLVQFIRKSLYVEASISIGSRSAGVIFRHVFPNIVPIALAMAVAHFPMIMIQAASLDYLGLGVPPSIPSLGSMVNEGQMSLFSAWWPAALPAIVMAAISLSVLYIGEQINRRIDR